MAFSHPSLNVHSSSAIHTAAASMRTTEQVCSSARLCLTPMQQIDSNDALHQFAQNLVVFFISKQTVSQIDTDSDNAINQIFLQKCPNLMVFNDTHTHCQLSHPWLTRCSLMHTPPASLNLHGRQELLSLLLHGQADKARMIPAKILETSTSPHSITNCSETYC